MEDDDQDNLDYANQLTHFSKQMIFYFFISIPPLGICLNLFALFVLYVRKNNIDRTPMTFLLKWQYIIDTIFLVNGVFNYQSFLIFGYDIQRMSSVACKLDSLGIRWIMQLSAWIQVVICIERLFKAYLSPKFGFKLNKKCIIALILSIMIVLVAVNVNNLFRDFIPVFSDNVTNGSVIITSYICSSNKVI